MDGEGLRVQGAMEEYMAAQKRVRECTGVAAEVRSTRPSATWRQTWQINRWGVEFLSFSYIATSLRSSLRPDLLRTLNVCTKETMDLCRMKLNTNPQRFLYIGSRQYL